MKSIMGGESSSDRHGVPAFGFNPRDKDRVQAEANAPRLFEMSPDPLEALADMLLADFAGRTATTKQIYQEHQIGRRFLLKNYQDALKRLEAEGRIQTDPPATERMRGGKMTFGENVKVTFPPKEG